jgi:monofunctional biosynthetic peptidoglycan transglycosylase
MAVDGAAPAGARRSVRRILRIAAWFGGVLLLALAVSTASALWGIQRLKSGTLVIERSGVTSGSPIRIVVGPANPDWTPLSRIARPLQEAVVTSEDDLFWKHHGFNAQQIRRSFEENRKRGRIVRGGSTITMQLARNLFLSPERTWVRKMREAFLTFWLERLLGKRRILETYLNVVEWGPDLYGIGPAARRYFGKPPSRLSLRESALLAIMLPAPRRYARYATAGMTDWSRSMVDDLLLRMRRRGVITQAEYQSACYSCPTELLPVDDSSGKSEEPRPVSTGSRDTVAATPDDSTASR